MTIRRERGGEREGEREREREREKIITLITIRERTFSRNA
jgi:hypothetical protein